ncbi:hypothetical protein BV25DRAFT_1824014 [Artomyces pyxidatus]|uniref:Uncharacterized protein n=1 Tax=Artomyces pyxidatus TaxID=48021 RepID=A0ACB8T409_9AGAM|nr:hypothetical protein BV25DRAFT_1824014 [Artomyces pyxidatus]
MSLPEYPDSLTFTVELAIAEHFKPFEDEIAALSQQARLQNDDIRALLTFLRSIPPPPHRPALSPQIPPPIPDVVEDYTLGCTPHAPSPSPFGSPLTPLFSLTGSESELPLLAAFSEPREALDGRPLTVFTDPSLWRELQEPSRPDAHKPLVRFVLPPGPSTLSACSGSSSGCMGPGGGDSSSGSDESAQPTWNVLVEDVQGQFVEVGVSAEQRASEISAGQERVQELPRDEDDEEDELPLESVPPRARRVRVKVGMR